MASLAAPAPTAPAGALASARDAAWELLLSASAASGGRGCCSVAALEALSSLAAPAAAPWRGWRPPAPAPSSASAYAPPSLELVRLAPLSSAAVARGAAAAGKARRAGWRLSAADVASAERAATAFHGLLLPISRDGPASSSAPSLEVLGGLLADVWLDGRVFPPSLPPADAAAAVAAVAAEGGGESGDAGDCAPAPPPPPPPPPRSSSAVPPPISSCYRSLLVEMISRGDSPAALRVADAAAARGATLFPEAEDALAVCRRCGTNATAGAAAAAAAAAGGDRDVPLLAGASLGALLAPLEASAEEVAAAAAAGARAAAAASTAPLASPGGGGGGAEAPSSPAHPSFDVATAAASLVAALVARGSVVELSASAPSLLDTAFGCLLGLALPEVDGDGAEEEQDCGDGGGDGGGGGGRSDWRACALPAAAACLAAAGSVELAAGLAAAHTAQSSAALGHLSACLPLLRAYLRALVLPALCDPARAPGIAARAAGLSPAPGAVAAVWRGLPGAAAAALRVLGESDD